jgi:hypothetical protein
MMVIEVIWYTIAIVSGKETIYYIGAIYGIIFEIFGMNYMFFTEYLTYHKHDTDLITKIRMSCMGIFSGIGAYLAPILDLSLSSLINIMFITSMACYVSKLFIYEKIWKELKKFSPSTYKEKKRNKIKLRKNKYLW